MRDNWFVISGVWFALIVFLVIAGLSSDVQDQKHLPRLPVIGRLSLVACVPLALLLLYFFWKLFTFYWWYYPLVFKASLTGSVGQILVLQLLMFPITISVVSLPLMFFAVLGIPLLSWIGRRTFHLPEKETDGTVEPELTRILWAQSFTTGVSLSFILSAAAVLLGTLFLPQARPNLSPQLMLANALFDGLTLMVTMAIFRWVVRGPKWVMSKLLIALPLDLAIACLFAVASLYVALLGTDAEVAPPALGYVLIGHDPMVPHHWQFGPYFWVMHSSFVPTLVVWFVIVSAAMIAFLLIFFGSFFQDPARAPKPLVAIGTIVGAWGALLGSAAALMVTA
jgi:hypothetical protein